MADDAALARPAPGLSAAEVSERLGALRAICVLERDADARARLARERPVIDQDFAVAVAARLRELRALDDLARHLHRGPGVAPR